MTKNRIDKQFYRLLTIFLVSLTGFTAAILGSVFNTWGVKIEWFPLFFTNWANLLIVVYYGLRTFSYIYDPKLYEKVSSIKWHARVTAYITFVLVLITILLGPLQILHFIFGIGPGTVPPSIANRGNDVMKVIENFFVHLTIPIIVIWDYVTTNHSEEQRSKENFKRRNTFWVFDLMLLIYMVVLLVVGGITRLFPYTIVDYYVWGWYVLIFGIVSVLLYYGITWFLIYMKWKHLDVKMTVKAERRRWERSVWKRR
jgi:hypothetical protein